MFSVSAGYEFAVCMFFRDLYRNRLAVPKAKLKEMGELPKMEGTTGAVLARSSGCFLCEDSCDWPWDSEDRPSHDNRPCQTSRLLPSRLPSLHP